MQRTSAFIRRKPFFTSIHPGNCHEFAAEALRIRHDGRSLRSRWPFAGYTVCNGLVIESFVQENIRNEQDLKSHVCITYTHTEETPPFKTPQGVDSLPYHPLSSSVCLFEASPSPHQHSDDMSSVLPRYHYDSIAPFQSPSALARQSADARQRWQAVRWIVCLRLSWQCREGFRLRPV